MILDILEGLRWLGCEKVVPFIREGETTGVERSGTRTLHFDELDTRAYTIHLSPDSLREAEGWTVEVKRQLMGKKLLL